MLRNTSRLVNWLEEQYKSVSSVFLLTSKLVSWLELQCKYVSAEKNSMPFKLAMLLELQSILVTLAISSSVSIPSLAPLILLSTQFLKFVSGKFVAFTSIPVTIFSKVATTDVLEVILLMVYWLLLTDEVTFVPFTVSLLSL